MDEKNLKTIRYLTGMIFAVQFIVSAVDLVGDWGWHSWYEKPALIARVLGMLLMAVSLFVGTHSLLAIGAGMQSVGILFNIIFGIVSAALFIIRSFWFYCTAENSFWNALLYALNGWTVLLATAVMLTCVVVQNTPQNKPAKTSQPTIAQKTENRIGELTKLKELLDTGVITQEEFDAKKKQLLNL